MNILIVKKRQKRTYDERTLGIIHATMDFNMSNDINIEMKKAKKTMLPLPY